MVTLSILALPVNVDANKATASFEEGVLTISIPKTEYNEKAPFQIDIN